MLRILCLHGNAQDAEIFSQRLQVHVTHTLSSPRAALVTPLPKSAGGLSFEAAAAALSFANAAAPSPHAVASPFLQALAKKSQGVAEYIFVDGPWELPRQPGQDVPMRCWLRFPATDDPAALDTALDTLRRAHATHAPLHGVLGFSQGAAVAVAAARRAAAGDATLAWIRVLVACSGYAPPDSTDALPRKADVPSMHVVGVNDTAVLPARSQEAAALFTVAQVGYPRAGSCLGHGGERVG